MWTSNAQASSSRLRPLRALCTTSSAVLDRCFQTELNGKRKISEPGWIPGDPTTAGTLGRARLVVPMHLLAPRLPPSRPSPGSRQPLQLSWGSVQAARSQDRAGLPEWPHERRPLIRRQPACPQDHRQAGQDYRSFLQLHLFYFLKRCGVFFWLEKR